MAGRRFQILFQGGPRIHLRHPAAGNAPPGDDSLGMTAVRAGLAGRPRRSITGYLTKNEGQHDPDAVADESDDRQYAADDLFALLERFEEHLSVGTEAPG